MPLRIRCKRDVATVRKGPVDLRSRLEPPLQRIWLVGDYAYELLLLSFWGRHGADIAKVKYDYG